MLFTLKDGFEVSIVEDALNDWRFLTMLRKVDKGETGLVVDIAEKLLGGEEEVEKLAKHLEVNGIAPADAMLSAIGELIDAVSELKNSSPSPV